MRRLIEGETGAVQTIGLVADIHDHVWNLRRALPWLAERTDALLVLGDLVAPFVMAQLGRGYTKPIHVVFGNNDGDRHHIAATAAAYRQVTIHGEFFRHELGGRSVVAQHFPQVADVIDPASADLVAFGHDHRARVSVRGSTYFVNPGPLMGYDPVTGRDVPASWAVYDAEAHQIAFWRVDGDEVTPFSPD